MGQYGPYTGGETGKTTVKCPKCGNIMAVRRGWNAFTCYKCGTLIDRQAGSIQYFGSLQNQLSGKPRTGVRDLMDIMSKKVSERDHVKLAYRKRDIPYPSEGMTKEIEDIRDIMLEPVKMDRYEFEAHWKSAVDALSLLGWLFDDRDPNQNELKAVIARLDRLIEAAAVNREKRIGRMK